jgi:hypothetical protein
MVAAAYPVGGFAAMDTQRRLRIYLNDHLATTIVARELAKRSLGRNRGSELGAFLEGFLEDHSRERAMLAEAMRRMGVAPQTLKVAAAWMAERVGRLKPNGQLTGYSPLSRLIEIEGLLALVRGARSMWLALARLDDRRLRGLDLLERAERAERYMADLERIELEFVPEAIGTPGEGARKAVEP